MKKLTLCIEALAVESFSTHAVEPLRGTVAGYSDAACNTYDHETCPGYQFATCNAQYATCAFTCASDSDLRLCTGDSDCLTIRETKDWLDNNPFTDPTPACTNTCTG